MAVARGVEIWTAVQCNAGTRKAYFPLPTDEDAALAAWTTTLSLAGEERMVFAVYRDDPRCAEIIRGRIATEITDDVADFTEWLIADLDDGGTGEEAILVVTCLAISAYLSSALYRSADAEGVPSYDYTMADATAEDVIDGPVRDALDAAGLDWIVKGTIEPTNEFSIDGSWETAQQIIAKIPDPSRASQTELRVRRNGTTDYQIDLLTEVGASEPDLHISTGRNLAKLRRRRLFAESVTRAIPRAQDDATDRTMAHAFWEVSALSADTYIEVIDPRGGTYPGPARFADQFNGRFLALLDPTPTHEAIADTIVQSATTTRFLVASTTGFSVGDYVQLQVATGAGGELLSWLDHPAAQAANGIIEKAPDFQHLTGAVSYAPNPFTLDMETTVFETQTAGANTIDSSTASTAVTKDTGNTLFTARVDIGDILVRASDNATIGTVATVTDNDNIVLNANAALTLNNTVWAVKKPTPVGWTASATDDGTLPQLSHQATAGKLAISGAFRIQGVMNATNQFNTPVFPVDKDKLWQFWVWVDCREFNAGATVTFTLRREDTGAQIGDAVVLDDTDDETNVLVSFHSYDVSASATGVRIRAVVAGEDATFDMWLGPVGCQPAGWTRRDVYGPFVDHVSANDLVHAGNDWLEAMINPESYDAELVDREQIDERFADEALAIGQTAVITDDELDDTFEQRLLDVTRDRITKATSVRFGTSRVTFGEFTEKRRKLNAGSDFERGVTLAVARRMIRASEAITDGTITEVETGDATATVVASLAKAGAALIAWEADS